jgi:hypothetical protein
MLRHALALIIKTTMVAAVFWVFLSFMNNYDFGSTFVLALLTVGVSYVIGDLWILPMSNNTVATLADIGLSTAKIWLIGPFILGAGVPFSLAFLTSLVLGAGEWFFHKYMSTAVLADRNAQTS